MIDFRAFAGCGNLRSVGPGFSPNCRVHKEAFQGCVTLEREAGERGFSSAEEWGKFEWGTGARRAAVLLAVKEARRRRDGEGGAKEEKEEEEEKEEKGGEGEELLERLAGSPDDMLRVILSYVGWRSLEEGEEVVGPTGGGIGREEAEDEEEENMRAFGF